MQLKKVFNLLLAGVLLVSTSIAQPTNQSTNQVSDSELKTFSGLAVKLNGINQNAQNKMMKAIEDNGMSLQRYQEIVKAKKKGEEIEMKEKEETAITNIQNAIRTTQGEMQKEINTLFEGSDMEKNRYIEINQSLSKDKELQERYRSLQEQNSEE